MSSNIRIQGTYQVYRLHFNCTKSKQNIPVERDSEALRTSVKKGVGSLNKAQRWPVTFDRATQLIDFVSMTQRRVSVGMISWLIKVIGELTRSGSRLHTSLTLFHKEFDSQKLRLLAFIWETNCVASLSIGTQPDRPWHPCYSSDIYLSSFSHTCFTKVCLFPFRQDINSSLLIIQDNAFENNFGR